MGQLVLLVVAAAWAAVLVPPLLRSRIENRPNSSVTDFRNQLYSLQRAMPSRGVAMRSMARPLAPSPLSRPAATGRPPLRSGVRTHHGGGPARLNGAAPSSRTVRTDRARLYDATPRPRSHGERKPPASARSSHRAATTSREALKRRRANVLFVLALVAGCSLFLAATTKSVAMLYAFGLAFVALCAYVYVLGQRRGREQTAEPAPAPVLHAADRQSAVRRHATTSAPARRPAVVRRPADRWSHAV